MIAAVAGEAIVADVGVEEAFAAGVAAEVVVLPSLESAPLAVTIVVGAAAATIAEIVEVVAEVAAAVDEAVVVFGVVEVGATSSKAKTWYSGEFDYIQMTPSMLTGM